MRPLPHIPNPKRVYMKELAKWAWIILLALLYVGPYIFLVVLADVIVFLLVLWLKPEWIEKY